MPTEGRNPGYGQRTWIALRHPHLIQLLPAFPEHGHAQGEIECPDRGLAVGGKNGVCLQLREQRVHRQDLIRH
jgi:hypothetical protein